MHILISGDIQVGKSTLIRKLIRDLPPIEYGFYTLKREEQEKTKIYIHPAAAHEWQYSAENCVGICYPDHGEPYPEVFDTYGASLLKDIPPGSIVMMDELGVMENSSPIFLQAVLAIFQGPYSVIAAIKPIDTPFLNQIRASKGAHIVTITKDTREKALGEARLLLPAILDTPSRAK